MASKSSIQKALRMGISPLSQAAPRAGPSRLVRPLSTTPTQHDRPSISESLGSILDESWGPASPMGSSRLGLGRLGDIKDDLRNAGVNPSVADRPSSGILDLAARGAIRPGYSANARPPRVDPLLDLFTNLIMKHGRKAEAQRRVGEILDIIRQSTHSDPLPLLQKAIHLTSPSLRIVSLRRAAKNVPIPSALDARQRARTGISWILKAAERGRKGGALERTGRIGKEVLAVLDGTSAALARKDEVHRLAAVNRSNLNSR